jgi:arylsulfatase A-like enzyme
MNNPSPRHPNVLFVFADQLRRDALGFAGDPNIRTPHLDRFAAESCDCVNAIAGIPVSGPSRACLVSGRLPHHHGVVLNDVPLPDRPANIGHAYRSAGYTTAYIGKWHLDGHGRRTYIPPSRRQGFDHWMANECAHDYLHSPYYAGDDEVLRWWDGYDAAAQTSAAIDFLGGVRRDKPFLLMLSWGPPHNPYHTAPEEFRRMIPPDQITLRPNVPPEYAKAACSDLAGYYAHILALDALFGRILRALDDLRLAENTLVVFWSDHGDMLYSHGQVKKQLPWDESVRVPLLLRLPGCPRLAPGPAPMPLDTPDLLPTLLDLCGVPFDSAAYDGSSKADRLHATPDENDAVVLRCYHPFGEHTRDKGGREYRGLRTPRHTYVRDLSGPWLLYDNKRDPWQRINLVGRPASAKLQQRLDDLLRRKLAASGDVFEPGDAYIKRFGHVVDATGTAPVYYFENERPTP